MTSALDAERLASEIASTEALLQCLGTGRSFAAERDSLTARREQLQQELESVLGQTRRGPRATATVLFGGTPVRGDKEIDVSFAVKSLKRYQDLIAFVYASRLHPTVPLKEKGMPGGAGTRLAITNLAHGCFGFGLAERYGALFGTGVGLSDAMETVSTLLESAASNDAEFADAVADTDQRVLKAVREFYEGLAQSGATIQLSTAKRTVTLTRERVERGSARTRRTVLNERSISVSGVCAAVADSGTFKLHRIEGEKRETIACKVDEEHSAVEIGRLGLLFRRACTVRLREYTAQTVGKVSRAYHLERVSASSVDPVYDKLDQWTRALDQEGHREDLPNHVALDAARVVIGTFWMCGLPVSSAQVDADGGIGIYAGAFPRRYVVVLCDNEGGVGALASERGSTASAWTWDRPEDDAEVDAGVIHLARRAHEWLGGTA